MNKWKNIKVGDLVRCAVMPNLGIGVVVEIKRFRAGQANAMCYWATPDKKFTYFLDQLTPVEDK
jgi:hypothetical protein